MSEIPQTVRAFVAAPLPPEVTARLGQLQRRLKFPLARAGISWVRPAQIHLTLKFLGDVPAGALGELKQVIAGACAEISPFTLRAETLGTFPASRKPRVIWVGVRGELELLRRLQGHIEAATCRWRLPEHAEYRPHLTLGRVRHLTAGQTTTLREKLAEFRAAEFGAWRVAEVELVRSELSAAGAEHSSLAVFPLRTCGEARLC
jgi:2'-5' RNA ligase